MNYSLHQATKETLYVPLSGAQKYKAKAVIDRFIDRLGKALSAITLILVIAAAGVSVPISLAVALGAIVLWVVFAERLGRPYAARVPREAPAGSVGQPARPGKSMSPASNSR